MIDALLISVRDAIRTAGYGYDATSCEIMDNGQPTERAGNIFLAVHQGSPRSTALNYMDEMYDFSVTLTQRVDVPLDRVGDQMLASKLAQKSAPGPGVLSFNKRADQLRAFLHMNWQILGNANNNLIAWEPDANFVYGFCEPAHYSGAEKPYLVGPEWFNAEPSPGAPIGLVSELKFEDCRRLQAIETFT
jgi:hypothetical protein